VKTKSNKILVFTSIFFLPIFLRIRTTRKASQYFHGVFIRYSKVEIILEDIKSSFGGTMKINIGKISKITLGLMMAGLLSAAALGYWAWRTTGYFSHGMFQGHSLMYFGTTPWGIILAVGVFLMIGISAISLTRNGAEQNNREIPFCPICGGELDNGEKEICPSCGETLESK
jgi:hypothetical protein